MSKHIHDLKNELREKGCNQRDSPECSWTSFLRSENCWCRIGIQIRRILSFLTLLYVHLIWVIFGCRIWSHKLI